MFIDGTAGYLLETSEGNVTIQPDGIRPTTRTGNNLVPTAFDITTQGAINTAIAAMEGFVSLDTAKGIRLLHTEKMEDYDGPEE